MNEGIQRRSESAASKVLSLFASSESNLLERRGFGFSSYEGISHFLLISFRNSRVRSPERRCGAERTSKARDAKGAAAHSQHIHHTQ